MKSALLSIFLILLSTSFATGEPSDAITNLIAGDSQLAGAASIQLRSLPADSIAGLIRSFDSYPNPDTVGWAIELKHTIDDSVTAPGYLYIPGSYNPNSPTPLIMMLHGGVSRPQFRDATGKNWLEEPVIQLAEKNGWLVFYPLGKLGYTWWDKPGMGNILWFVKEIKRRFNVDDDRVVMCGFSDGGSASYHFAMLAPTDFSLFFPWSGYVAVGTLVGKVPVYLPNLRSRPLFASNGGKDQLYPAGEMKPNAELMLDAGARLSIAFYDTAGHNYGYMPSELNLMTSRVERHPRDPFPSSIYFETSDLDFARSDWLTINEIVEAPIRPEWYREFNMTQSDERLSIGFGIDTTYKGKGVRVAGISADSTLPALSMGLEANDIVVNFDDTKIVKAEDIAKAKTLKKRGEEFRLSVKRKDNTVVLKGKFPPSQEYELFPHPDPSGAISAKRVGNNFLIETSGIKSFSISLSPELVRFDQPVKVTVNGKDLFEGIVKADSETILRSYLMNRDRKLLTYARLDIAVP